MNQVPQASKVSPSLYLADQDPSISPSVSPQGVVKWKDLDQEVKDWVVSLMPPKIKQPNDTLYAQSRRIPLTPQSTAEAPGSLME